MIKNTKMFILISVCISFLTACSTGDLRAWNDAMAGLNGQTVTYPDETLTEYVGDVKWVRGITDGNAHQYMTNTGSDYCKIRVLYEDGDYDIYKLGPGQGTRRMYVSIYNQPTDMEMYCGKTSSAES